MKGYLLLAGLTALLLSVVEASNHQDKDLEAFNNAEKEQLLDNVEDNEDELDDDDNDDDEEEIGQSSLLSMLKLSGRQSVCDGKATGACKKNGGSCVTEPFKDNCVALQGSSGKLKKKACKSKDCQCCLPPPSCAGKIKKNCSKNGGSCVLKPFKSNCKGGTLDKKSCKGKHCMCCIPGPTTATKPVTVKYTTLAPTTPGPVTGKEATPEPTTTPKSIIITDPTPVPTTSSKPIIIPLPTQGPTTTVKPTVIIDPSPNPATTFKPIIITDPTPKPTTTFKPIIIIDPTPTPTTTPKPVTVKETTPEPITTPNPVTVKETTPEPTATPKPVTVKETTPEPTTTPKPVTKPPVLAPCPSPFKLRGEECLFVHEDKSEALDWDESRQRCLSMGGDLAQPEDMVDFVEHIKADHPNAISTIWLGATDREVEQEWKWVSGAPVPPATWSPWPGNQPSGDGNCMEIHYWPHTDFYLNDWYCHNKGHFACEFERTQQAKMLAKYSAPQDNIWDDTQCSNAGNFLGKSLAECLMQCEVTPGCTAINHRAGHDPDCVLRACELPIPAPTWGYADYNGYSLITKPCVAPFKLRGSECFYVHEDKSEALNWDESRQRCQSLGGDLAQPKDMVDFVEHIKTNHPNAKSTIWLGATDREVEQDWKWVSGAPVPPAIWAPWPDNQPSGDGNCMEIHYWPHTDFYLNDWWCDKKGHFACEFDMMP